MTRSIIVLTLALAVGTLTTTAAAPAVADDSPVNVTVSTPADPIITQPGATITTWLRISNNGTNAIPVTVTPATVILGDNGTTSLIDSPDPRFATRVISAAPETMIPPGGRTQLSISIHLPSSILPDTYVLGFLVTPAAGGNVRVVNRVAGLIAITVPGSTDRRLTAGFVQPPLFVIGTQPTLTLRVTNIGRSALQFSSESQIDGFGSATPADIRKLPLLLPAGRYRDVTVTWSAPFGFSVQRVSSRVGWNNTQATTSDVTATQTVISISPALIWMIAAIALLLTVVILLRRRFTTRPA